MKDTIEAVDGFTALIREKRDGVLLLVERCVEDSTQLEETRKTYKIDRNLGFNIFTSISEQYYKEKFHSDILATILDPGSDGLHPGSDHFLTVFLRALAAADTKPGKKLKMDCGSLKVGRETGHVDILLHDETQAIIVENKINGAVDQPDQIPRYVQYVKTELKKQVLTIVYLPLYYKKPSFEYSKEYRELRKEIEEKLIILPAISPQKGIQNRIDLTHGFLDMCAKEAAGTNEESEISRVYLGHYSKLVKKLGGDAMMNETAKDLLWKLMENSDSVRTVLDMVEVWNKRDKLIAKIVLEKLKEKDGFRVEHGEDALEVYKPIDDDVAIGFEDGGASFGFAVVSEDRLFSPKLQEKLKRILESIDFGSAFGAVKSNDGPDGAGWVWRELETENTSEPFDSLIPRILRLADEMERRYSELPPDPL